MQLIAHFLARLGGALFSCEVPESQRIEAVALSTTECEAAHNSLLIVNEEIPYVNFTVCVAPVTKLYNNWNQLTEMVEVNRLFGAQRFVFYNNSMGPEMARHLRYYVDQGIAYVVPWNLEPDTPPKYGYLYHGQLTSMLDCLYRNLHNTQYIAFLDLDELLVPRSGSLVNWSSIVSSLGQPTDPTETNSQDIETENVPVCDILFPHALFRPSYPDDVWANQEPRVKTYHVSCLLKTTRDSQLWPVGRRSKYLARADQLLIPDVHRAHVCRTGSRQHILTSDTAALHHYRLRIYENYFGNGKNYTLDRSIYNFRESILERIEFVHQTFNIIRPL